jgi:hypothetical protein
MNKPILPEMEHFVIPWKYEMELPTVLLAAAAIFFAGFVIALLVAYYML